MLRDNNIREILTKEKCIELLDLGATSREVANMYNVSHTFIQKLFKEKGLKFSKSETYCSKQFKGYYINDSGYVMMRILPGRLGEEREHIIVAQNYMRRAINPRSEAVHHIDGIKINNEASNLCVMDKRLHDAFHTYCRNHKIHFENHKSDFIKEVLNKLNYTIKVEMYADLTRIYEV